MSHLIFYASVIVVAALAMRPKLSLAIMSTTPVALAITEALRPGSLPDWLLISGVLLTAYCLAAVVVALFFRRGGDIGGSLGSLPIGREARYSESDKAGLWCTFVLLIFAASGGALVAADPPHESVIMRVVGVLLVPSFSALATLFWMLLRDRDIIIRIGEDELEISGGTGSAARIPWNQVAGYTFRFGVFRVYDTEGRQLLRVDNTIDGFLALLYHVNRKTFRVVA